MPAEDAVPMVSVVIIFLNAARFLDQAIASVRAQTFDDWELVLIDDGSTDGGTAIAEQAARARPERIRVRHHPGRVNRGTSASRNLGLHAARGETVLYLDADDILFTDALTTLVALLGAEPAAVAAFGSALWWNWDTRYAGEPDRAQDYGAWTGRIDPPHFLTEMTRTEHVHPANCSCLFRRDALLALGGFEASFTGMYEDTVLLAKVLLQHTVVVTGAVLSAYRMHAASQCHRAEADGTFHALQPSASRTRYLRWLAGYVRSSGQGSLRLRLMILREIWAVERPLLSRFVRARATRSLLRVIRGRRSRPSKQPPAQPPQSVAAADTGALAALASAFEAQGAHADGQAVRERLARRLRSA